MTPCPWKRGARRPDRPGSTVGPQQGAATLRRARRALPLIAFLVGSGGGCSSDGMPSEQTDVARAEKLAADEALPQWPAQDAGRPVLLYVDRSRSMRGFLDPAYPGRVPTDYRSVLDGFAARLRPARVFGFGNEVREAAHGLGVLGDPAFYSDGNTEMEEVLARVRADSSLDSTHVIMGDGRRTDPNAANGQFAYLREEAERWTADGGTFIVAASHAPFTQVASDASGCRGTAGDANGGRETCPLYAFAFVAPGDQRRVATALAATFENLFVTPLPALPPTGAHLAAGNGGGIAFRSKWTTNARGVPIARVRGPVASNQPLRARVALADTASPAGRGAWAALRGRRLVPRVSVRVLADDTASARWQSSAARGGLLRPADDPLAIDFITRGQQAPRYLYRVELHPDGEPVWLERYDADAAGEPRRTYGLSRLFEGFRAVDPAAVPPVFRLYAVVN